MLLPPVLIPPNVEAGGRSTNGPVWVEGVAADWSAKLMDYAVCLGVLLAVLLDSLN